MTPSVLRRRRPASPPAAAPATVALPAETYADLCAVAREQLFGGAPDRAAQTADRALEALPHGLEAQRLLGLALLERGEARRAIVAFQSALAVDPLDVVAQTGLAEATERIGGSAAAEAEWRRAWELEPGLAEVAASYQATVARAGALDASGGPPPLTRVALARLYLRGGLFEHAAMEARALLPREPHRADLQLLLAEALWRLGDAEAAATVAGALLEHLPDCAMANLLVAAHWQTVGRDVSMPLDRVRAVDPLGTIAARLFDDREEPPLLAAAEMAASSWHGAPTAEATLPPDTERQAAADTAAAAIAVESAREATQPLPLVAAAVGEVAVAEAPEVANVAAAHVEGSMLPVGGQSALQPAPDLALEPVEAPAPEPVEAPAPEPVEAPAPEPVAAPVAATGLDLTVPEPVEAPALEPAAGTPVLEPIAATAGVPEMESVTTAGGALAVEPVATPEQARAAGDEAMRTRRYLDAMRAYGAALRLLREQGAT